MTNPYLKVKGHILSISVSFLLFPFPQLKSNQEPESISKGCEKIFFIESSAELLYHQINLSGSGLSLRAFETAYKGYQKLVKKELVSKELLAICDLSQSSSNKRFYVIDLAEQKLLISTMVAHGRNSGHQYASRFSNRMNSHQTSLGYYITGQTYLGEHGLSLRLKGLEPGFNSMAEKRGIVIHGANYVNESCRQTGRSYGCPAVPGNKCREIIELIKEGACLFIYHPTKNYLLRSKILNG